MAFSSFCFGALFAITTKFEMSAPTEFGPTSGVYSSTNQSCTYSATTKSSKACFVDDSLAYRGVKLAAYTVIFLTSLVLNSSTIYVVWKEKSMKKTVNYFIVNMAVSDLIITLVYMPRQMTKLITGTTWMMQGTFGVVSCKIVPSLHAIAILASILTLLAISVDRFNAVVFPMRRVFTRGRVSVVVAMIWVLSIAARLPYIYAITLNERSCSVQFRNAYGAGAKQIYSLSLLVTFCVMPLAVETVLYSIAIFHLKSQASLGNETTAHRAHKFRRRAARRLLQLTCSITVAFIICWTPYFIAQIAYKIVPCYMRFWRFFLAHSNSALNPLLCAMFNPSFRQGFKQILCFQCTTRRNINNEAIRQMNRARYRLYKNSKV